MKIQYMNCLHYQNLIRTKANLQSVSTWGLNVGCYLGTFMGFPWDLLVHCRPWTAGGSFRRRMTWADSLCSAVDYKSMLRKSQLG